MEIRNRDLSLMAASRTLEGMCHKGSYVGVTVRCKRAALSIFGYGEMLERTVFRSSSGSKNNQTQEKMLMYEVFSLLLCDIRNVSARSVTVDTVRLLKDKIETKLDKAKLVREESGASAADCSAKRMLDGVANVYEKSRSVNGVDKDDEDDVDLDAEMSAIQLDDLMSEEDAMNNMQFSEGNDDIAADNDAENVDEVSKQVSLKWCTQDLWKLGWEAIEKLDVKGVRKATRDRVERKNKSADVMMKRVQQMRLDSAAMDISTTAPNVVTPSWRKYIHSLRPEFHSI